MHTNNMIFERKVENIGKLKVGGFAEKKTKRYNITKGPKAIDINSPAQEACRL